MPFWQSARARGAFSINWAREERWWMELISKFRTDAKREKNRILELPKQLASRALMVGHPSRTDLSLQSI